MRTPTQACLGRWRSPHTGVWRNWQRSGLQNRRLQVRVLSPLRQRPDRPASPAPPAAATTRAMMGRATNHHATEEGEVADRKRRGEDAAEDRLEELFDDV